MMLLMDELTSQDDQAGHIGQLLIVAADLDRMTGAQRPFGLADAVCARVDPALWFPEPGEWTRAREAKRLCRTCPLMTACRSWALAHPAETEYGIWGGLTALERRAHGGQATEPMPAVAA